MNRRHAYFMDGPLEGLIRELPEFPPFYLVPIEPEEHFGYDSTDPFGEVHTYERVMALGDTGYELWASRPRRLGFFREIKMLNKRWQQERLRDEIQNSS